MEYVEKIRLKLNLLKKEIQKLEKPISVESECNIKDLQEWHKNYKIYEESMEKLNTLLNVKTNLKLSKPIESFKEEYEQMKNIILPEITCENKKELQDKTAKYQDYEEIQNNIDILSGSVKVLLRLYGKKENQFITTDTTITDCNNKLYTFNKVYNNIKTNEIDISIESIKKGNSQFVMLGYGASGSGKTHTLIGQDSLVENILMKLDISNINLKIDEIYGTLIPGPDKNESTFSSETVFEQKTIDKTNAISEIKKSNEQRKIKKTPNNDVSSRSHLFFILKLTLKNGVESQLVIIDLAGKENPFEISTKLLNIQPTATVLYLRKSKIEELLTNISSLKSFILEWPTEIKEKAPEGVLLSPNGRKLNNWRKADKTKKDLDLWMQKQYQEHFENIGYHKIPDLHQYIQDLLSESFFINESINTVALILKRHNKKNVKAKITNIRNEQSVDHFFEIPEESKFYKYFTTIINQSQSINYVLLATISENCIDSEKTLSFASKISN